MFCISHQSWGENGLNALIITLLALTNHFNDNYGNQYRIIACFATRANNVHSKQTSTSVSELSALSTLHVT